MLENLLWHVSAMFSILRAPGFLNECGKYAEGPQAFSVIKAMRRLWGRDGKMNRDRRGGGERGRRRKNRKAPRRKVV